MIDANLPFTKDLSVEIQDANELVITDGPDASLMVVPEVDPSSACISNDAAFTLKNGVGIFPGSICDLGQNIRIRFSTFTSLNQTLYTPWTPSFNVTGELVCHPCMLGTPLYDVCGGVCLSVSLSLCVCVFQQPFQIVFSCILL